MSSSRRLHRYEIAVLRLLVRRRNAAAPARLGARRAVVELWRRGLVLVWYRQAPETCPSLQGPYFSLSERGQMLAAKFVRGRS